MIDALWVMNAACARIGETPLQDLSEETTGGQAASLIYEETVDFNLGLYLFSFSKTMRQLSVNDLAVPLTGWTVVFDLPPERIEPPIYVTDDVTTPDRRFSRYTLVEDQLHSDCNPLFAQIRFRPDPHLWSPTFRTVNVTSIAAKLAMSQASDRALMDQLNAQAYGSPAENYRGGQLGAAIRADAFSTPPRTQNRDNNPLTRSLRGGQASGAFVRPEDM